MNFFKDACIKLWGAKPGKIREIMNLEGHSHTVSGLDFISPGLLVSSSKDKLCKICFVGFV